MWIHDNFGILVGIDSGCPNCSGKYYSLDGSTNLNDIAAQLNTELGLSFEPVVGNQLLVFKSGGLTTMMMDENTFVTGLLCSTINEQLMSTATCNETIKGLLDKSASKFICMESCTKGKVFGVETYHPDSNLCRAMVHSGQ